VIKYSSSSSLVVAKLISLSRRDSTFPFLEFAAFACFYCFLIALFSLKKKAKDYSPGTSFAVWL
jgi:hypothetical protein